MSKLNRKIQRESARHMNKRVAREVRKAETTYTFTNAQLNARDRQIAQELGKTMEERFIKVFFTLPIKICHEQLGWNAEECQWLGEALCDEYEKNLYGNCTDETVKSYGELTERLTGIKFER